MGTLRTIVAVTACAALSACLLEPDDLVRPDKAAGDGVVKLKDPQGVSLLGDEPDALPGIGPAYAGVLLSSGPFSSLEVEDGELVAHNGPTRYDGDDPHLEVELLTTAGDRLRIVEVHSPETGIEAEVPPGMSDVDLYSYEVEFESSGTWRPLCRQERKNASGTTVWNRAWVVPGGWRRGPGVPNGYQQSPGVFTFVCPDDGAAAKCLRWGYAPWEANAAYYAACTRMTRADYCGADESYTLDDTHVDMYDFFHLRHVDIAAPTWDAVEWSETDSINTPIASNRPIHVHSGGALPSLPMGPDELYLEAGWTPERAACVGRMRWQIIPGPALSGGACDAPPNEQTHLPFCEVLSPATLHNDDGALLYNSSFVNERGVYTWRDGPERLMTSRGLCAPNGMVAQEPAPGYDTAKYMGIVFTRWAPGRRTLNSWRNVATGRFITTLGNRGAAWKKIAVEGYIVADADGDPNTRPEVVRDIEDQVGSRYLGAALFLYRRNFPVLRFHTGTTRPQGWGGASETFLGWILQPHDMGSPFTCGP